MKKIIVVLILATVSVTSYAAPKDWKTKCKAAEKLATGLMELRQEGAPLSIVLDQTSGDKNFDKLVEVMAIDAWEIPAVDDETWKSMMITKFKDKWYMECVKEARTRK